MQRLLLFIATIALLATSSGVAVAEDGNGNRIYDSLEIAGNVVSQAFEATQTSEFGDRITFAGSARDLGRVTLSLSSWGCQTGHAGSSGTCVTQPGTGFTHPITFNIYAAGAGSSAGALITTRTQTFKIPFRPTADNVRCTEGRWYDEASKTCFNGLQTFITFDFHNQHVTLPNTIVFGVAYNTTHYGYSPIGENAPCFTSSAGCGYDSLNVGIGSVLKIGSKPDPGMAFMYSTWGGNYCDNGLAGTGTFRLDSPGNPCWMAFGVPGVRFTARHGDSGDDHSDNNGHDD